MNVCYTEKMTSFTRNGGIKGLQRHGKQASGTYGHIDNLSISYGGNRIAGVSDGAPVVTQNGSMDFPGGYAIVGGSSVKFYYYTRDHLGNTRAVINGSTGAIEQTVAYYPFGAVIADLGTPAGQPYKFGGKELQVADFPS